MSLFRERENFQMYLAEQESKAMRNRKAAGELDELVKQCDEKLIIRNVSEARQTIKSLIASIKGTGETLEYLER